jgi:predicted metalloprotease with PDZ domain
VEWESPAWIEGLRRNEKIIGINQQKASVEALNQLKALKAGDIVKLEVLKQNKKVVVPVILGEKTDRSFEIKRNPRPTALQAAILKAWLKED